MPDMSKSDRVLLQQVHPVKLLTDLLSGMASLWFFRLHALLPGIALATILPIAASFWVLRYADLEALRHTAAGIYAKRSMTASAQVRRLAGFVILCVAVWLGSYLLAVFGATLIVHAWVEGLLLRRK